MKLSVIGAGLEIDGRNVFNPEEISTKGFRYVSIGRVDASPWQPTIGEMVDSSSPRASNGVQEVPVARLNRTGCEADKMSSTATLDDSRVEEHQRSSGRKKIWVDLDNSPHVPFFRPIIDELRKRNYDVLVTARDAYQVRELLEFYGVSAKLIGRHYGKHKVLKGMGTCLACAGRNSRCPKGKNQILRLPTVRALV